MAVRKSRIFKDISLSFKPNPVTGDLNVLTNERAITRSVRNLVQTGVKERFYSDVGTDVTDSLFNFVDEATGGVIAQQITDSLMIYEPRITNTVVGAYPMPDDNNFEISISYEIIGLEAPTQSFSFILEATR
tara:strand:+ start:673 stop:1068 length:396 start_codon:yes stop_codon:yes gene_type:complete